MGNTSDKTDEIDKFFERTYNPRKIKLLTEEADGSLLSWGQKVERVLKRKNADVAWRSGYLNDFVGDKYKMGLSGRRTIQVGLGYEWGDTPAMAYIMASLAFAGLWEPKFQKAAVVRGLLTEIFKLKTTNLEKLMAAVKENKHNIIGEIENPIWLHILALQEHYNFDDTDLLSNTPLSEKRLDEMEQVGSLLVDYELAGLAEYLNSVVGNLEANYTADTLNELQLRATIPASFLSFED